MNDLISRQAAIDAINQICPIDTEYDCTLLDRVDVRCVLTDLPSAQPEPIKVSVDREMTEEELKELKKKIADSPVVLLPSAQPEIIRCKDCKWYGRADKRRFYRGTDCLNHRIDTIVPDKDYCSRAERRTDE